MIERLKDDLVEAGQFGRDPVRRVATYAELDSERGVTRPAGSEAERLTRDFAVQRMREAGLEVRVDRTGNILALKPGTRGDLGAVVCGSHLDSVINGGQFDGALGVFGAIEAIRRLADEGFAHERPVGVMVFTGEEGSAFGMTLLGSAALVGKLDVEEALQRKDHEGRMLAEALAATGYRGKETFDLDRIAAFLELHIEQGPVLYNEKVPIGVVETISGIAWVNVIIRGVANHAGTTPMHLRRDALAAAAELVQFVESRARNMAAAQGSATVGTVGRLNVFPNGINIVPGRVEMGIDIRDVVPGRMDALKADVLEAARNLEKRRGVEVDVTMPPAHSPTPLSAEVVSAIERSARELGIPAKRMPSGAAHDSQNMATRVKTGMIFVPSVGGISHSPMEWSEWEDIEKGVQVLTRTMMDLSRAG